MSMDPSKPVDWYLVIGVFFVLLSGGLTLQGDRVCFISSPTNDLQRIIGAPTLVAYFVTKERPSAAIFAFIFWGVVLGIIIFSIVNVLIKKVLLPNQIRMMVHAERQQEFLKNKFRQEIPEKEVE